MKSPIRTTLGSIKWTLARNWLSQGVSVLAMLLMTRLLSPADFGLFGFAIVFMGIGEVLTTAGFGASIIQKRDITPKHLFSATSIQCLLAVIFSTLIYFLSEPVARRLQMPQAAPLIQVLCWGLIPASLASISQAVLEKRLAYKRIMSISITSSLAGICFGVVAACRGMGAWSLVIQYWAQTITSMLLYWKKSPIPLAGFSMACLRDLSAFAGGTMLLRLVQEGGGRLDRWMVSYFFGPVWLGIFIFGRRITDLYQVLFFQYQNVLFSSLSHHQNQPAVQRRILLASQEMRWLFSAPGMIALCFCGPDLVRLFLDQRWVSAGPTLQILLAGYLPSLFIGNMVQLILRASGRIFVATGLSFLSLAVRLSMMVVGAQWGYYGMLAGAVIGGFLILPLQHLMFIRFAAFSLRQVFKRGLAYTVAFPCAVLAGLVSLHLLPSSWPSVIRISIEGSVVISAFYVSLLPWRRYTPLLRLYSWKILHCTRLSFPRFFPGQPR